MLLPPLGRLIGLKGYLRAIKCHVRLGQLPEARALLQSMPRKGPAVDKEVLGRMPRHAVLKCVQLASVARLEHSLARARSALEEKDYRGAMGTLHGLTQDMSHCFEVRLMLVQALVGTQQYGNALSMARSFHTARAHLLSPVQRPGQTAAQQFSRASLARSSSSLHRQHRLSPEALSGVV